MARRSIALTVAAIFALALLPAAGRAADPVHKPSATCSDYDLEEARITEQLDKEPNRVYWKVTGPWLDVFIWNMKWAFDIDVDADTVYIIDAMTPGANTRHVHVFTVRNHCITMYKLTWMAVIAEMLRPDAWERGNPHVDGQTDRPVPPNRPADPRGPAPTVPEQPVPGVQPNQ